jgi:hypothetical protein
MTLVFVGDSSRLNAFALTVGSVFLEAKAQRKACRQTCGKARAVGTVITQRDVKRGRSLLLEANGD